jgi:hypothetical protein
MAAVVDDPSSRDSLSRNQTLRLELAYPPRLSVDECKRTRAAATDQSRPAVATMIPAGGAGVATYLVITWATTRSTVITATTMLGSQVRHSPSVSELYRMVCLASLITSHSLPQDRTNGKCTWCWKDSRLERLWALHGLYTFGVCCIAHHGAWDRVVFVPFTTGSVYPINSRLRLRPVTSTMLCRLDLI